MRTISRFISLLAALSLLISGCAGHAVQAGQEDEARNTAVYESILGRPVTDEVVSDFLSSNDCSRADQFLLCQTAGMALWTDSNQVVETVYLYLNHAEDFEPFQGELPYGLKFYDTMEAVEYKLNRQGVGNGGLPDEAATPDHMHYRATYHQAGMTILYNYPFPDEGATIHAILLDRQVVLAKDQP